MDQLQQVMDHQVEHLTGDELAGCWNALCGMVLSHTVVAFRRRCIRRKDEVVNRTAAMDWLRDRRVGRITFRQCCEALDFDGEKVSAALFGIAETAKKGTRNRTSFGVTVKNA